MDIQMTYTLQWSRITLSAINPAETYGWVHLRTTMAVNDSISHQSSGDPWTNGWVHLRSAVVKNNSISYQFNRDTLAYR